MIIKIENKESAIIELKNKKTKNVVSIIDY